MSSFVILGASLTQGASTARAAAEIRVYAAYFDPFEGPDPVTNTGLNREYIVIRNEGTRVVNLRGWVLFDLPRLTRPSSRYVFPDFRLRPGRSVRVHTGSGTDGRGNLYWGRRDYLWGDDSDTVTLQNAAGVTKSTCSWVPSDASPYFC